MEKISEKQKKIDYQDYKGQIVKVYQMFAFYNKS